MKRKITIISVLVILLSLLSFGTLAFFTYTDVAHNVITTGNIEIELNEWADLGKTEPFPENGIHGVMPGTDVVKVVEVKNTGDNPAYVRVKVVGTITLQGEEDPNLTLLGFDWNTTNWEDGGDGFWYYKAVLESGDTTEPLFEHVKLAPSMGNEYQEAKIEIDVKAYATQSENNGASALTASGWPAE